METTDFAEMIIPINELKSKLKELQKGLSSEKVTIETGGGMVTVTATANLNFTNIKIEKSLIDMNDPDMLEDLTISAINQTILKCNKKKAELSLVVLGPLSQFLED